jgi:hypothetical protein
MAPAAPAATPTPRPSAQAPSAQSPAAQMPGKLPGTGDGSTILNPFDGSIGVPSAR